MPFPSDEEIMKTSGDLVAQLQTIFGKHPGFRPAHAKGIILTGTFTPSSAAATLSSAPHFHAARTPIWARFSDSTGIPNIPDTDPNAGPRGFALRFHLGDRKHTDIIAHSTPFFPVRTGAEFLEFLRAVAAPPAPAGAAPAPSPIEQFLATHPAAAAFVAAPKPVPLSFANELFYGINAVKLIDSAGKATAVRYRVVPDLGTAAMDAETLASAGPGVLMDEIKARVMRRQIVFRVLAQVAEEGDVLDDATVLWPENRRLVELGLVVLDDVLPQNEAEQKHVIFDPVPRVQGIEPSEDPLLEMRAAVYLISGKERRAAA